MIQRATWIRRLVIALAVIVVLTVTVIWVLPPILATQLTTRASEALGRRVSVDKVRLNPLTLSVTIENLAIYEPDETTRFLGWRRLYVNADALGSLWREWSVSAIELDGLVTRGQVNGDGSLNVSDLLARFAAKPATPAPESSKPARPIRVGRLSVTEASVEVADLSRPLPFRSVIGPLTFELTEFRTVAEKGAPYRFQATTESGERLAWSGTLRAEPFQSQGEFRLENITLPKYAPFYADRVAADVKSGALSVRGRYELDLGASHRVMSLTGGVVELRNLAVHARDGAEPVISLPVLDVVDISADALTLKAVVGAVRVTGGHIKAQRNAAGLINLLALVPPAGTSSPTEAPPSTRSSEAKPAATPDVHIRSVALQDVNVEWSDEAAARPAHLALSNLNINLANVSLAPEATIPIDLRFGWAPQGSIQLAGTVGLNPVRADVRTEINGFALLPLSPYVEPFANVRITQGTLSGKLHARVSLPPDGAPEANAEGDLSLEKFGLVDGVLNEDLAGITGLHLRGLKASAGKEITATLEEVALDGPYARVLIAQDKTVNLVAAGTPAKPGTATTPAAIQPAAAAPTTPTTPLPPPRIEVGRIIISDGDFRFTDRSVQPAAAIAVSQFGGTIGGLSSVTPTKGEVDLKGVVDGSGPIAITGRLDPLSANPSVDLKVDVHNVDLVPLSPYTGKFAGYELARGKLGVDVKVAVNGKQIDSANVVTLNQFTFGNPVSSPDATKLPVRLAVALLKDMDGKIVIDLPVQGRTDDPEFRVGRVVLRVVVNLLTKAAMSPFSLLGAAFGGGGDELAYQEFAPGTADLLPTELAKLETMSKALANRPGLSVDVGGSYDAAADAYALRQTKLADRVRRTVWEQRRQKDANIPPPAEIVLSDTEHAATIKALFDQQFPPGTQFGTPLPQPPAVAAPPPPPPPGFFKRTWRTLTFASQREQRRLDEARAKSAAEHEKAVAAVVAAGLPLHDMTARLAEATTVDEADLRALAQARAERVRAYFVAQGIAGDRVFLANPGSGDAAAKGPRVFLALQ